MFVRFRSCNKFPVLSLLNDECVRRMRDPLKLSNEYNKLFELTRYLEFER